MVDEPRLLGMLGRVRGQGGWMEGMMQERGFGGEVV